MAMQKHPTLNFYVTPDDKLFTCPYNRSHQVLAPRLSQHLMKCRKAHLAECKSRNKKPLYEVCRWNSNHHHEIGVIEDHENECPDREMLMSHLAYHAGVKTALPNLKANEAKEKEANPEAEGDEGSETDGEEDEEATPTPPAEAESQPINIAKQTTATMILKEDDLAVDGTADGVPVEDWDEELREFEKKYAYSSPEPSPPKPHKEGEPVEKKMITTTVKKQVKFEPPTYNPIGRIEKEGLVYNPQGLTRSQRVAYRANQKKLQEKMREENLEKAFSRQPVPGPSGTGSHSRSLAGSVGGSSGIGSLGRQANPAEEDDVDDDEDESDEDEKEAIKTRYMMMRALKMQARKEWDNDD